MDKYAIIVAGGTGTRMGSPVPKQFLTLGDKPVLWYAIDAFLQTYPDIQIIVVLPSEHLEKGYEIVKAITSKLAIQVIAGGATRFHSVKSGLTLVKPGGIVFVHDAVRCLVTPDLIRRCYEATISDGNALPAVTAIDTIRILSENGAELVDRDKVKIIQTPQTFSSDLLIRAYQQQYTESFTDDASVAERFGEKIHPVEGEGTNLKITRKMDLLIATEILKEQQRL